MLFLISKELEEYHNIESLEKYDLKEKIHTVKNE